MMMLPLLSSLLCLPLVGVVLILALMVRNKDCGDVWAKYCALLVTLITFALSVYIGLCFNYKDTGFQFEEIYAWVPSITINYHVGIDGISLSLILLTTLLMPLCILASWNSIQVRVKEYMMLFLILEFTIIGVFIALDTILFYIFFEAVLIPMFLIIGIWGGENRVYASIKFFLYTLAGSVLMLAALIYLYIHYHTTSIPVLIDNVLYMDVGTQKILWLAMFIAFAIKIPMFPVHTWLPDAHVQAPTAGSMILAGILLKMGGYGMIRFLLAMMPHVSEFFANFVFALSVIAIIYASLVALVQTDMKKLIAYSSVAHMGIVTIGLFTANAKGVQGAMIQMISHGIVSAALFFCVGILYDRLHTKEIAQYGGVVEKMPLFAALFMVCTMSSIGLPGTSGFIGEFLVLMGVYPVSNLVTILAAIGVVLGAAYMLWLYRRVMFGPISNNKINNFKDINCIESTILIILVVLTIAFGIYPKAITDMIEYPVYKVVSYERI